ncbi:unnamed protein product [Ectocarpus sp. 8 AP-2014]
MGEGGGRSKSCSSVRPRCDRRRFALPAGGWGRLRIHITLDAVTGSSVSPEFAASIGGSSAP